jgi:hypothetical protein
MILETLGIVSGEREMGTFFERKQKKLQKNLVVTKT